VFGAYIYAEEIGCSVEEWGQAGLGPLGEEGWTFGQVSQMKSGLMDTPADYAFG
jgi:hypothetical protein